MVGVVVREATETDAERWDAYVAGHCRGTPYHRYAWRDAMTKAYGIETHYYLAENLDDPRNLLGVLPVATMPKVFGQRSMVSLPYCDRGEPLANSPDIEGTLLDRLCHDIAGRHELRGTSDAFDKPLIDSELSNLQVGEKVRLLLELPSTSTQLMDGFKSKHRSQINKAKKNGLVADTGNSPDRVQKFFNVFVRNMRDLGSPTHSLKWFLAIASAYGKDCSIGLVYSGDDVIGAGIVLRNGHRAAIPWASTIKEYNRLAPNMLLYWTLLEEATDSGVTIFDFGRSNYAEGTYRFKTQWGARAVPLDWRTRGQTSSHRLDSQSPEKGSTVTRSVRTLAGRAWQKLPLPLSVALGSRLRPYISL